MPESLASDDEAARSTARAMSLRRRRRPPIPLRNGRPPTAARESAWNAIGRITMRRVRALTGSALIASLLLAAPPSAVAATALPAHVFSPYFETWTTDSLTTIAQQSGARYFTLAFLETLSKTSCTLAWDGDRARTLTANPVPYASDIASLRAIGGDVLPSFGGW